MKFEVFNSDNNLVFTADNQMPYQTDVIHGLLVDIYFSEITSEGLLNPDVIMKIGISEKTKYQFELVSHVMTEYPYEWNEFGRWASIEYFIYCDGKILNNISNFDDWWTSIANDQHNFGDRAMLLNELMLSMNKKKTK